MAKNIILWVVIAIVLMTVFHNFTSQQQVSPTVAYSEFLDQVKQGNVSKVDIYKSGRIEGQTGSIYAGKLDIKETPGE